MAGAAAAALSLPDLPKVLAGGRPAEQEAASGCESGTGGMSDELL